MTKYLRLASVLGIIFGALGFARPAHAFTEGACKDDAAKLCGDVKPGGGAVMDCMKTHASELSQACKDNIAEGKAKMEEKKKELEAACGQDIKQFCANVTPGEGREFACLKSYEDKISAGCKAQMPKRMGKGMHKGAPHDANDQAGAPDDGQPSTPPAGK